MNKFNYKPLIEKSKNILLAFLIFGAIGAYFGYNFHASLVNTKPVAATVAIPTSK